MWGFGVMSFWSYEVDIVQDLEQCQVQSQAPAIHMLKCPLAAKSAKSCSCVCLTCQND